MRSRGTHDTMASREALLKWCSQTCTTYPQVEITNLSTSFRDGLAFCAIIHKHRPDLIDFRSLSRTNIYENNQLAFEVAETKLGIPAFLIPEEMLATEVPDYLSVITYLSQFYHYFTGLGLSSAGPSSLRSLYISSPNKRSSSLPSSENDDCLHHICHFCIKPVHLIQRHVFNGAIWHRSCFRCKMCHGTLAAGFYIPGKDAGCFMCSDHILDSAKTLGDKNFDEWQGCISLGGSTLISVPQSSDKTKSHDRQVYKRLEVEQTVQQESSDTQSSMSRPPPPQPVPLIVDVTTNDESPSVLEQSYEEKEAVKIEEAAEFSAPSVQAIGESKQLASEQMPVSVSAAKTPPSQTGNSTSENDETTDGKDESPLIFAKSDEQKDGTKTEALPKLSSAQVTRENKRLASNQNNQNQPAHVRNPKNPVKTNHPWLGIIHPGPWTQLPPVESPGPPMHSKRGPNGQVYWYKPRVSPPNPFSEDLEEEDAVKTDVGYAIQLGCSDSTTSNGPQKVNNSPILPRSFSAPAVKSTKLHLDVTEENQSLSLTQSKVCKEDHYDANTEMSKSKTCQALTSGRAPAPGHGFPLIKRKVQADQYASAGDLQAEIRQVKDQLEALEERGVVLETDLRECKDDKEEEHLVTEWLALTHVRQCVMRRDTELVYLTKQQALEESQADVEYELRCLLNKPESVWSEEDRGREQSLMAELLVIIEQRNQIVSILDQDRKREREEDAFAEEKLKNQELQEGLKVLKKSKGKFKAAKVFKMNRKAECSKDSKDKKNGSPVKTVGD